MFCEVCQQLVMVWIFVAPNKDDMWQYFKITDSWLLVYAVGKWIVQTEILKQYSGSESEHL